MSSEICALCKGDCTPWAYLEILDKHICSVCFEHLAALLHERRLIFNLYADIIGNKLKEKKEVLKLVKNEIENFKIKDNGLRIITNLISNFEQLNIECYLLEEIIAEVDREHTISTSICKESDDDKEVQGNKGNKG